MDSSQMVVVLAPDVLGHSFDNPACARVLVKWRDGRLAPSLNRQLLQRYLKMLQDLGLTAPLLRRWGWWLTSADKVRFLDARTDSDASGSALCVEIAKASGAAWVIAMRVPPASDPGGSPVPWITPQAFLDGPGSDI
ncbi:MAG: hypothetical protein K9N62_01840 [Verrucomicrobia bacterium]|nr:hypothetical protein [Verrucomicrobiota bacterium]